MGGAAYADQISGFTALPGINNKMSQGLLDGIYWVPQMVCKFSEQLLPVPELFSTCKTGVAKGSNIPLGYFTARVVVYKNEC